MVEELEAMNDEGRHGWKMPKEVLSAIHLRVIQASLLLGCLRAW